MDPLVSCSDARSLSNAHPPSILHLQSPFFSQDVFEAVASGALKVRIDRHFPLAEAGKAHAYLEAGHTTGKLLLDV